MKFVTYIINKNKSKMSQENLKVKSQLISKRELKGKNSSVRTNNML